MRPLLLSAAFLFCAALAPVQSDDKAPKNDEAKLKAAYQATDDESLIQFLAARAKGEIAPKELNDLIETLSDKNAATRDKACRRLIAIGTPAVPKLRVQTRSSNAIAAELAKNLLQLIEHPDNTTGAAIRLLVARRAKGAVEALLAYLPHAEDETIEEEIGLALIALAYDKNKASPALLKALEDPHALRRASAITALCSGGAGEHQARLRKLLVDKAPNVRLGAAMALARANDPKAISTLIVLMGELKYDQGCEIEAFLLDLAAEQAPKARLGQDDVSRQKASAAWAKWWLEYDTGSLLKELEKRTLTEELLAKATTLIENLGDEAFDVRRKAEAELKKMGPMVVPLLKVAVKSDDSETRKRARNILASIDDKNLPLPFYVPRQIALRKPKGAIEALLAYLPFVPDDRIVEEIQQSAAALAYEKGVPHPALLKALTDKIAVRRAVAGAALASGPLGDNLAAIRVLLKDKDLSVRLRVSLALAQARDPEAVPVLIRVLSEGNYEQVDTAEEYLFRLARDNPPKQLPQGDGKQKERALAWENWWDDHKKHIVMVGRDDRVAPSVYLGHILLIQTGMQRIVEMDRDFKPRLTLTGIQDARDAQCLSKDRILVAEFSATRVTERNTKGEILWEHKLNFNPIQVERLRNGNTFIVGLASILEINRKGNEVWKYSSSQQQIRNARRLPNGNIAILTTNQLMLLDKRGEKELKTVRLPTIYSFNNDILNNGNVLVLQGGGTKVVEYDRDGKEVWSKNVGQVASVVRLPNKNTLTHSYNFPAKITEFDPSGNTVREHQTNEAVYRVRYR